MYAVVANVSKLNGLSINVIGNSLIISIAIKVLIKNAKDKRVYRPPVSWTGDGFLMVQEDNSITFYVRDLPTSMNYNLVLRYQTNVKYLYVYYVKVVKV